MKWEQLLSDAQDKNQYRQERKSFRNDYDTIICSALFCRLQDKAQVFPLDEDDYVRI